MARRMPLLLVQYKVFKARCPAEFQVSRPTDFHGAMSGVSKPILEAFARFDKDGTLGRGSPFEM